MSVAARNETVRKVIELLAARQYRELEALSRGIRLTAEQIESAVREYGRTVIPLPSSGVALIDYVSIQNANPAAWSAYVPLFTQEEGRSDLTIDLTLVESGTDLFEVELNDLRVL